MPSPKGCFETGFCKKANDAARSNTKGKTHEFSPPKVWGSSTAKLLAETHFA